ncbi:MAG: thioredoxin family protein [Muribaculaceae bacterium]|nr:thioredoxin family protein [Muribaculaceae bacterium]
MKKLFIYMAALVVLVSCNSKSEQNADEAIDGNETVKSEMPVANSEDEGQTEWIKQTTIMSSKPMVIDFFATWCGPCKELAPILDELEQKHKGDVIFQRIDVDKEPELAQEFNVEAIPMLLFVTPKGEYQSIMGYQEAPVIEAKIAELLTRSAN